MKTLVIGLESASAELLFHDDRLATIRSLMEIGCHGRLEGVVPAEPIPSWLSLATGRDPGSLGAYGARARVDRSYRTSEIVDPQSIAAPTLWGHVDREGGKSIVVGGPFDPAPPSAPDLTTDDRAALRDSLFAAARDRFEDLHDRLESEDWSYFQFIEPGLDLVQRVFWRDHDPEHPLHDPNGRFIDVVRDYYLLLDQEIAGLLDRLNGRDVAALIVSPQGVQRSRGGVRINEWLIREGLLSLRSRPDGSTPFSRLDVDWSKTKAWGEGGAHGRIYLNVKGREPEGVVDPADCRKFRDDLKARLEAAAGDGDEPLDVAVFKPEEVYRNIRGVAPDLLVEFGGGSRWALDDVGAGSIFAEVRAAAPDEIAPTRRGAFVLACTALAPIGEIEAVRVVDLAPTLLQIAGLPPLPQAQGGSLIEGRAAPPTPPTDDDELVRERLRGLGYIG